MRANNEVVLLCTVRGCRLPLEREAQSVVCANRHSFDIARSGYINLLQPQDKRSKNPGDTKEASLARRAFYQRGFANEIVDRLATIVSGLKRGTLLDVGCGEGFHAGAFAAAMRAETHGIDISTPAIELAAKKYRDCTFVIANADRFLPYADGSFAVITSITARMNAPEFRRVLGEEGVAVIAVSGADDLIELREAILGEAKLVDRTPSLPGFSLVSRETIRIQTRLDRTAIDDVLTSSYRAMRSREREKLSSLTEMNVTLSRDVIVYRRTS